MSARYAGLLLFVGTIIAMEPSTAPVQPGFIAQMTLLSVSLAHGKAEIANDMWDKKTFGDRLLNGLPMDVTGRQHFLAGLNQRFHWGETLLKNIGESGSYQLLRAYRREGVPHAIFRLINEDGTLNYHDVEFRGEDASTKAVDVYVYLSAEMLSETMRVLVAAGLPPKNADDRKDIPGFEQEDALSSYKKLHQQIAEGDHKKALEAFSALSEPVRKNKTLLLLRLQAAQQVGDEEHLRATQDLITAFPDNEALDFLLIDAHLIRKEWDLALACIDRLDQFVGKDPYLDSIRSSTLMEAGLLPAAREKAEAAVRNVPEIQHCWWMLTTATLRQKDHRATAEVLDRMQKRFSLVFGDLGEIAEYKDFVASPEHAAWKRAQEKITTPP